LCNGNPIPRRAVCCIHRLFGAHSGIVEKSLSPSLSLVAPFPFLHKCEQGTFGLQGAPFGLGPGPLPSESLMSFFTDGTRPKSYAQIHMPSRSVSIAYPPVPIPPSIHMLVSAMDGRVFGLLIASWDPEPKGGLDINDIWGRDNGLGFATLVSLLHSRLSTLVS